MIKSIYIHIPFCNQICNYCAFSKMYYIEKWIQPYLKALKQEIESTYQQDIVDTIYIGGGTPTSLKPKELEQLLKITNIIQKSNHLEFTIECNIEDITKEKMNILKKYGVNRLSIGIQTFNRKHLKNLNRNYQENYLEKVKLAKKYFNNISIDLMYGLQNQTLEELKEDIQTILKLDIPHISCYSLMIEPHTVFYNQKVKPVSEDIDYQMYQTINNMLKSKYIHYETSNYGKPNYFSNHNLNYWNNGYYYGFGLGASGYIKNYRYTNTKKINEYLEGKYIKEKEKITKKDNMIYEMILGLRKKEGVSLEQFKNKYGLKIEEAFDIQELLNQKKLIKKNGYIYIPSKYSYIANEILVYFV